jgi:hypothetical protein
MNSLSRTKVREDLVEKVQYWCNVQMLASGRALSSESGIRARVPRATSQRATAASRLCDLFAPFALPPLRSALALGLVSLLFLPTTEVRAQHPLPFTCKSVPYASQWRLPASGDVRGSCPTAAALTDVRVPGAYKCARRSGRLPALAIHANHISQSRRCTRRCSPSTCPRTPTLHVQR